ncbi:MAG: molybdopterin-dependent oxidoreductase [Gammaproteobacteria bacterium]|nr:molybdopterin-dependent oxidoreductase [Gammaproteobacteria bacterium]
MRKELDNNVSISACPHDCPSTCALEVTHDEKNIYKVKGASKNTYTSGVVCAKVSRYAERTHHPDRLTKPLMRVGKKGSNDFKEIEWEQALDIVAENFISTAQKHGTESIWPYFYAGTMGLVQRDGINRLRHAMKYSGQHSTICSTITASGFRAGVGTLKGPDPREMALADVILVWGCNPASTQVNVMKHIQKARKDRNAKLIVVDPYKTRSAKVADFHYAIKPGTDGALACSIMHILFRDNYADKEYMDKYTDDPKGLEEHVKKYTPEWGSKITGLPLREIEEFAKIFGTTKRLYSRMGYGFTRQRNGASAMHAAVSLSAVCGKWQYEGGGAFYNNGDIYNIDKTLIEGLDLIDQNIRILDQSRIGSILTGDRNALIRGGNVYSLIIQNTNPLVVAPESLLVREGFSREDLFVCVHEQFMTETAKYADIVLPATTFVEHDDLYIAGGHQHITFGPKLIEPIGESRSNHKVLLELSKRLGAEHKGFNMTEREIIDVTLKSSNHGSLADLEKNGWKDVQPDFNTSHFINGFGHKDKKFHFKPDWSEIGPDYHNMPEYPDYMNTTENASKDFPFRLVTAPAHNYLNSSFTETSSSQKSEVKPKAKIHSNDIKKLGLQEDDLVVLGNNRGKVIINVEEFNGMQEGVIIVEGIWPNEAFVGKNGINTLVGSDPVPPNGGAAFHDTAVWIKSHSKN